MSRPHICFIQSQCVPWAEPAGSLRWLAAPGVQLKILSVDSDDESVTAVVRVPPGFQRPWASRPGQYLEMLMLDGDWTLEESGRPSVLLGPHGYLRLAASSEQNGQLRSRAGAVALLMTGSARPEPPIVIEDTYALPWQHGAAGSVTNKPLSPGIASKILRRDAASGEQSFLYCAMPQHPPPAIMPGKFTHPVIEELFTLSGSYVFGDVGRMSAGGYAFWREGQWHGPAGSETGYCLFIRVLGGPLFNQFSAQAAPFSWRPEYRPSLPPHLQAIARPVDEGVSW